MNIGGLGMNLGGIRPDIANNIEETKKFNNGFASLLAKQIFNQIKQFEKEISPNEEVGVCLVQYGEKIQFAISRVGYKDPHLIFFHGLINDNDPIQLVQHVSQISFVLVRMKMKIKEPDKINRQIGFGQD